MILRAIMFLSFVPHPYIPTSPQPLRTEKEKQKKKIKKKRKRKRCSLSQKKKHITWSNGLPILIGGQTLDGAIKKARQQSTLQEVKVVIGL